MNVANLQIEGLCMAIIAVNHALVGKGVLTQIGLNGALKKAEAIARSDERFVEDLNPSSRCLLPYSNSRGRKQGKNSAIQHVFRARPNSWRNQRAIQRYVLSPHGSLCLVLCFYALHSGDCSRGGAQLAGNFLFSHHPNRTSLKLRKKFALLFFCETTFGFTIH